MHAVQWSKHWMLVFVPIALVLEHVPGTSAPLHFLVAALGIVPIARLIGESTENLAHYTGDSIGALLNTMFGNLPELIICVVALKAGLYAMVAASLVGAILFNLLLVLGLSFLLGGLRRHTLEFNVQAVRMYSTMMFIAVISLALPSIYEQAFAPGARHDRAKQDQHRLGRVVALALRIVFALHDPHPSRGICEHRQGRRRRARGALEHAAVLWRADRQLRGRRILE